MMTEYVIYTWRSADDTHDCYGFAGEADDGTITAPIYTVRVAGKSWMRPGKLVWHRASGEPTDATAAGIASLYRRRVYNLDGASVRTT